MIILSCTQNRLAEGEENKSSQRCTNNSNHKMSILIFWPKTVKTSQPTVCTSAGRIVAIIRIFFLHVYDYMFFLAFGTKVAPKWLPESELFLAPDMDPF